MFDVKADIKVQKLVKSCFESHNSIYIDVSDYKFAEEEKHLVCFLFKFEMLADDSILKFEIPISPDGVHTMKEVVYYDDNGDCFKTYNGEVKEQRPEFLRIGIDSHTYSRDIFNQIKKVLLGLSEIDSITFDDLTFTKNSMTLISNDTIQTIKYQTSFELNDFRRGFLGGIFSNLDERVQFLFDKYYPTISE